MLKNKKEKKKETLSSMALLPRDQQSLFCQQMPNKLDIWNYTLSVTNTSTTTLIPVFELNPGVL